MTPLEFLQSVWPKTGLYCIATPWRVKGYRHEVFESIEAAAEYAEQQCKLGQNVFYNVHTLKEKQVWDPNKKKVDRKTGKETIGAWVVRVQRNMSHAQVLFFDLDVKPDSPNNYATQTEAREDIERFCRECGLPEPTLVSSGGGVHVYWHLEEEISTEQWTAHAFRLRQLATAFGVKFDPARTTDTASVLRVVGTNNLKLEIKRPVILITPGEVTSIAVLETKILDALNTRGVNPTAPAAKPGPVAASKLGSNVAKIDEGLYDKVRFSDAIMACPQLLRLWKQKGIMSEPEWKYSLDIIRFCEDPEKTAIKWSQGDPRATDEATLAKLHGSSATGPTSCATLMDKCGPNNEHICRSCPFYGKGSNPKTLSTFNQPPAPPPVVEVQGAPGQEPVKIEIGQPPQPYIRRMNKNGGFIGIWQQIEVDGKMRWEKIYDYDIYPLARQANFANDTEQQVWMVHLPHAEPRQFTISAEAFIDMASWRKAVANKGIYPSYPERLHKFMSSYIRQLQREAPPTTQYNHIGWINDHTDFVLPDRIIMGNGTEAPVALGRLAVTAPEIIKKKGTLVDQIECMKFYNRPGYELSQFYIWCALAAPLFFATGHKGVIVNAHGESGCSKSTTLFAASSCYGPPEVFAMTALKQGSTENGRSERTELLANLPFCFDEITEMEPEELRSLALGISYASGTKVKLSRSSALRANERSDNQRSNIMLTTSNNSMYAKLASENKAGVAAAVRVFEMEFQKLGIHKPWEAEAFMRGITDNYGHIGDEFLKVVVPNIRPIVKRIHAMSIELGQQVNQTAEERFWIGLTAAALVTGELTYKLRLLPFAVAPVREMLLTRQIPHMRELISDESRNHNPVVMLTNFLETINGNIIKPKIINNHAFDETRPRELYGHFDQELGVIYCLRQAFKRYCERENQYYLDVLKKLHQMDVVISLERKVVLGRGTQHAKTQSRCFLINAKHPELAEAVTELSVATSSPGPSAGRAGAAAASGSREHLKAVP